MFTMHENLFEEMLSKKFRWLDIVVYNYIYGKSEVYGFFDKEVKVFDNETKTYSHYKDVFGLIMSDLELGKKFCIKGSEETIRKEMSHILKRLETAGYIERMKISVNNKKNRIIIPLVFTIGK